MEREPVVGREVLVVCGIARIVAVLLLIAQFAQAVAYSFTGPQRLNPLQLLSTLLNPLAFSLALYLLSLLVMIVARIEARTAR